MRLKRRKNSIKMRLVPYGSGWTDLYADFGNGELYFIISNSMGCGFEQLMEILYHLHPDNEDYENLDHIMDYKYGKCTYIDGEYVVTEIEDELDVSGGFSVYQDIPWRASFTWDEEGAHSVWTLEREATLDTSFMVRLRIEICRGEPEVYEYNVHYEDLCYAVADTYTRALKTHGFWGYHAATFTEDIHVRHLLFLKSVALGNYEARKLTRYEERGNGETSDFKKELKLLLFDM